MSEGVDITASNYQSGDFKLQRDPPSSIKLWQMSINNRFLPIIFRAWVTAHYSYAIDIRSENSWEYDTCLYFEYPSRTHTQPDNNQWPPNWAATFIMQNTPWHRLPHWILSTSMQDLLKLNKPTHYAVSMLSWFCKVVPNSLRFSGPLTGEESFCRDFLLPGEHMGEVFCGGL